MRIEATDYVEAANERLAEANLLYEKAHYALALYVAGVAVESLLRAYIAQADPILEGAHNLPLLLRESNLRNLATPDEERRIFEAVSLLSKRWRNDLRYTSNHRLRRRLKKDRLDRGIRGDFLKENCRIAIDLATIILRTGAAKWKHS
jgi:HEPN domain-containing protein